MPTPPGFLLLNQRCKVRKLRPYPGIEHYALRAAALVIGLALALYGLLVEFWGVYHGLDLAYLAAGVVFLWLGGNLVWFALGG